MKKKKIFVVGTNHYANWLPMEITSDIDDADIVMFTGGEDVCPAVYKEKIHPSTIYSNSRDEADIRAYRAAQTLKLPTIGICRGSQFLTVMNGGKLIQDVSNHGIFGTHKITDVDGNTVDITSTHHQMHYPFNLKEDEYEIFAWSTKELSTRYKGGDKEMNTNIQGFKESEIIYFPKTNSLGIQGHPEHLAYDHPTNAYLREVVKLKLNI